MSEQTTIAEALDTIVACAGHLRTHEEEGRRHEARACAHEILHRIARYLALTEPPTWLDELLRHCHEHPSTPRGRPMPMPASPHAADHRPRPTQAWSAIPREKGTRINRQTQGDALPGTLNLLDAACDQLCAHEGHARRTQARACARELRRLAERYLALTAPRTWLDALFSPRPPSS